MDSCFSAELNFSSCTSNDFSIIFCFILSLKFVITAEVIV